MKKNRRTYEQADKEYKNGWEALAMGIIKQAIMDYRSAFNRLKEKPDDDKSQWKVDEIKNFFRSEYFNAICDFDPEWLIRKIESECENIIYSRRKKL